MRAEYEADVAGLPELSEVEVILLNAWLMAEALGTPTIIGDAVIVVPRMELLPDLLRAYGGADCQATDYAYETWATLWGHIVRNALQQRSRGHGRNNPVPGDTG